MTRRSFILIVISLLLLLLLGGVAWRLLSNRNEVGAVIVEVTRAAPTPLPTWRCFCCWGQDCSGGKAAQLWTTR